MKISVIVPSYNQGSYLRATLDSIVSQSHQDVEVRVYDGGSTDNSVDIIKSFGSRVWWVSERDGGQAAAINRGLIESTGEIVAFLNSDDVYFPGALARVALHFSTDKRSQIVYGAAEHLRADGSILARYPTEPWNYSRLQETCYICQPAVFWRRDLSRHFGLLDAGLNYAMDYEYWLRMGRSVPFCYLADAVLSGSRLHEDTKTLSQKAKVHREILDVVMRHGGSERAILGWLGHLAYHEATEKVDAETAQWTAVFAGSMLSNAAQRGIRIPMEKLSELSDHLKSAGL